MSLQSVRDTLLADATVRSQVGDKVGPVQVIQGEKPPYVVLLLISSEVFNALGGFAGLNRSEYECNAWAYDYTTALTISQQCRAVLEAAGLLTTSAVSDEFVFEQDAGLYRHGFTVQVFE